MKNSIFIVAAMLLIASCNKKEEDEATDSTRPVIENFTLAADSVQAGGEITVYMNVSDNAALSQAKLDLHPAGDGHSHRRSSLEFEYYNIIDLKGAKTHSDTISIAVPMDADKEEYHFTLLCTDQSGNESELKLIELIIY